ncbi:MAG: hypothetical protein HY913_04355 [Desulfomonile tiedjei]|nr:hypothetical protein [Desulfomonile tiedjei]
MMRRLVTLVIIFVLALPLSAMADFWASRQSNKYHHPSCVWAKRIKAANLVVFKTPAEAVRAGYLPCNVCKPPVPRR